MSRKRDREHALEPLALSVKGVAQLLQISERTLWRMVATGEFPSPASVGPSGKLKRWSRATVEAWVREHLEGTLAVRVSA